MLYLLKEGCRWHSRPRDSPDWRLCYYYYSVWCDHIDPQTGLPLLARVLKNPSPPDRRGDGREEETTLFIIDAQSVKNTDTAEFKGYDTDKKVSGIKRHLAVDSRGLPHLRHVTTAKRSELHTFAVIPKRWVVERSISGLEKHRRLWKS